MKAINVIKVVAAVLDPTGTTNGLINAGERVVCLTKELKNEFDKRDEEMVKDEMKRIGF